MSTPIPLSERERLLPHRRLLPLCAVGAARLLARLSPRSLRRVLTMLARGATAASYAQALAARREVVSVSILCAGEGCLQRSVATALLCRARGTWPTWCTGVRTRPYFKAHAWVEADGRPVDEPEDTDLLKVVISVPPVTRSSGR
jgi:transglutaminase superfamily protein